MKAYSVTRKGLARRINEDRALVKRFGDGSILLAVADGMGGHAAGDLAARIAVESLGSLESDSPDIEARLEELAHAANRKILEAAAGNRAFEGMGTTLTFLFTKGGIVNWVHAGDSRAYLFRDGKLLRITDDHTIPGLMLHDGEISEEEARKHPMKNVLLNALGRHTLEIDTGAVEVRKADVLLLSTDGLHDAVPDEEIEAVLGDSTTGLEERLKTLLSVALAYGSRDDITVAAAEME